MAQTVMLAQVARHAAVLLNMRKTSAFLEESDPCAPSATREPAVLLVVPILNESSSIHPVIRYFAPALSSEVQLVIAGSAADESFVAWTRAERASLPEWVHLIAAPRDRRNKGGQINYTIERVRTKQGDGEPRDSVNEIVVIYDSDSRPALRSLEDFRLAASRFPEVSIFQQCARFIPDGISRGLVQEVIANGAALRANRFVLAYELPRLLSKSSSATPWHRLTGRLKYANVVGHGLGVRRSYLEGRPFPEGLFMEDMLYGFDLCTSGETVECLRSLDVATSPSRLRDQFHQAERWFLGPATILLRLYMARRKLMRSPMPWLVGGHVLILAVEWLLRLPAPLGVIVMIRERRLRLLCLILIAEYSAELWQTTVQLGGRHRVGLSMAGFVPAQTVFGLGAWSCIRKLVAGEEFQRVTVRNGAR